MNPCSFILACSGPRSMQTIQESIRIGYICAALGGVLILAMLFHCVWTRRFRFTLPIAGLLMWAHPAWTMSAVRGDCGFSKRHFSYLFTAIFIGMLIYQYAASRRAAGQVKRQD